METYSVGMALQDYMPVALSGAGLFVLARMLARMDAASGTMAYLGAGLVTLGGLCKATWKLLMALSSGQNDIVALDDALFWFLAPGFIFFACALWYGQRKTWGPRRRANIWILPGILVVLTGAAALYTGLQMHDPTREGRQIWFFILLGMTTIMNFMAGGLAIWQARKQQMGWVAGLFALNLVSIIILQGLARVAIQSVALQWVEQLTNTVAQGAFVWAALKLAQVAITRLSSARPVEAVVA